jgi:protoporphyrinogen oxidase
MDIIIGAGISGISYAGFTNNDYLIIEKDSKIGGYCKTIKQNDFIWDYSGHFFHFQNKWLEEYIVQNIKCEIANCRKHTQIRYKEKYIDFPFQKNIHQLEQQEFIDCLYDLFDIQDSNYSTFKQMLYAKFGKSIAEKFLIPYNEKLYACDVNLLDTEAMGRFFPYVNKEDIILNFKKVDNSSYNTYFTYPKGGAIEYVNSLFSRIDKNKISLNEKATAIDTEKKIVYTNKRKIKYDNLISTIPFPDLLKICNVIYNKMAYSWNKVLVFNMGFDKKGNDTVNNWVYFPDKEISFYRIGYYDNIFMNHRMSLYVELGFDKHKFIDVEYYMQKVINDLRMSGIISDHKLIASHHVVMDPAYVHITKESIEDVKQWKDKLSEINIYSIGRYGSWTYCSIEDNILEAKTLTINLKMNNQ